MPVKTEFMPRSDVLTFEEIVELVGIFVELGVTHLRVTGGEPLARRGIVDLIRMLSAVDGVRDLSMTSNGLLLARVAEDLVAAGLTRVNVSIDTIDPERFRDITRWGDVRPVIDGMRAARDAGLSPVKINAVMLRGVNDDQAAGELIRFASDEGFLLRFIEYMPIGVDEYWKQDRFLKVDDMRRAVEGQGFAIEPIGGAPPVGGGPAKYWNVTPPGGGSSSVVGFIAALTHNFCERCNRVRMTSDGRVRECLTSGGRLSLRDLLRAGTPRQVIRDAINASLYGKVDGHGFDMGDSKGGVMTRIPMSALGG